MRERTGQTISGLLSLIVGIVGVGVSMGGYENPELGWVLMVLGGVSFALTLVWTFWPSVRAFATRWRLKPKEQEHSEPERSTVDVFSEITNYLLEGEFVDIKSGREVEYHGDKSPVIHKTLGEIKAKLAAVPRYLREEAFLPFQGKWIVVTGPVREVDRRGGEWVLWIATRSLDGGIPCCFESGDSISHADRDDHVELVGRLHFEYDQFKLQDCEILREIWRP